jgi:hypothetical protein
MTTLTRTGVLTGLRRAADWIDSTFCRLNRIQWDAPWRPRTGRC